MMKLQIFIIPSCVDGVIDAVPLTPSGEVPTADWSWVNLMILIIIREREREREGVKTNIKR